MINWIKRIISWLFDAKLLWITIGTLIIFGSIAFWSSPSEPRVRIVGLLLQLFGISTVLKGISDTRKLFNHPSLLAIATQWLKSFPKLHLPKRNIYMDTGFGEMKMSGSGISMHVHGPNPTLEDRVRDLESKFDLINRRTIEFQGQIAQEALSRKEALEAERNMRTQEMDIVRKKLEATETGGLNISLMGLIWLAAGLIMSTASLELSHLF